MLSLLKFVSLLYVIVNLVLVDECIALIDTLIKLVESGDKADFEEFGAKLEQTVKNLESSTDDQKMIVYEKLSRLIVSIEMQKESSKQQLLMLRNSKSKLKIYKKVGI